MRRATAADVAALPCHPGGTAWPGHSLEVDTMSTQADHVVRTERICVVQNTYLGF
ncbi:hypothetical protein ACFV20_02480 [Streptomyces sp. NPDC059696]|uniref:hypothetical protein n=1 Tax=Streptomyces sp. NPDC059696 TaxID=3346911 RepID=UPI00368DE8D1